MTAAIRSLENNMDMNVFLFCAAIFVLSFFTIWAFWMVEKLRGNSAPKVVALTQPIIAGIK